MKRANGFALVFTLILIGFIAVIVVSLGLLTRVETRIAANRMFSSQARQNALVALDCALAHLQREAGPDLRTTARADIATPNALPQPYLTGVWVPGPTDPVLRTWLASGNHGDDPLALTPFNAPSPTVAASIDEVFLVDRGTVSTSAQRVKLRTTPLRAPKDFVPGFEGGAIAEPIIGHIAYWIGDQGIKTSIAFPDSTNDVTANNAFDGPGTPDPVAAGDDWSSEVGKRERLRQMRLSRPRSEIIFSALDPDDAAGGAQSVRQRLARVLSFAQIPMISPSITGTQVKAKFHHITPSTAAVLVDATAPHGQLRRDLSDTPDVTSPAVAAFLRERPHATTGNRAYARVAAFTPDDSNPTAWLGFSKGPVLTECLIKFRFVRDEFEEKLIVLSEVQAELWNPYACGLSLDGVEVALWVERLPVVEIEYGDVHISVDLNAQMNAIVLEPSLSWLPGQIKIIKGGHTLSATGTANRQPTTPTVALPLDPLATELKVRIPTIPKESSPVFRLTVEGRPLARYQPSIAFVGAEAITSPAESDGDAFFGFGFALKDDLACWSDGARASSLDPRAPNVVGDYFESASPPWTNDPTENGGSIDAAGSSFFNPSKAYALFELPRQEVVSVGALQHLVGLRPNAIGNAWGDSSNELFDRTFLSSIPRWASFSPGNPTALPSPFVRICSSAERPPRAGDPFASSDADSDDLRDIRTAAKYLLIHGAFNINSTSVDAWSAVLGGNRITPWSYGSSGIVNLDHAHFRFSHCAQEFFSDPTVPVNVTQTYTRGVRELSTAQIITMAQSIVAALRARGKPFPTLATFLNSGIIANAIAAAGVNADLPARAAQSPGWLTQADVLTSIAPFIVPRSDSFLIRAYGDWQNPATGEVESRAWCEAVVQRIPDLTAPIAGYLPTSNDIVSPDPANFPFGRRFVVVQFRWLGAADI